MRYLRFLLVMLVAMAAAPSAPAAVPRLSDPPKPAATATPPATAPAVPDVIPLSADLSDALVANEAAIGDAARSADKARSDYTAAVAERDLLVEKRQSALAIELARKRIDPDDWPNWTLDYVRDEKGNAVEGPDKKPIRALRRRAPDPATKPPESKKP